MFVREVHGWPTVKKKHTWAFTRIPQNPLKCSFDRLHQASSHQYETLCLILMLRKHQHDGAGRDYPVLFIYLRLNLNPD